MPPSAKRSSAVGALLTVTLVVACGSSPTPHKPAPGYSELVSPGTRPPANDVERGVLKQLASLTPGTAVDIAGSKVTAGASYASASGRECRPVTILANARVTRLVCNVGGTWSFVPNAVTDWEAPTQ